MVTVYYLLIFFGAQPNWFFGNLILEKLARFEAEITAEIL